jgi:hypothetical protein
MILKPKPNLHDLRLVTEYATVMLVIQHGVTRMSYSNRSTGPMIREICHISLVICFMIQVFHGMTPNAVYTDKQHALCQFNSKCEHGTLELGGESKTQFARYLGESNFVMPGCLSFSMMVYCGGLISFGRSPDFILANCPTNSIKLCGEAQAHQQFLIMISHTQYLVDLSDSAIE